MIAQFAWNRRKKAMQDPQKQIGIHHSINLNLKRVEGRKSPVHRLSGGNGKWAPTVFKDDGQFLLLAAVVDPGLDLA